MLKKIYRKLFPKALREKLFNFKLFFVDHKRWKINWISREKNVSFGKENKDKHFYVVRRYHESTGLLSCYLHALGHLITINTRVETGELVPVMDMFLNHYELAHNKDDGVRKVNAWDYYFEQFSNYTMTDVLKSKKVTLGYGLLVDAAKPFFGREPFTKDMLISVLPIHNKYFKIKDDLKRRFIQKVNELLSNKRVLGTNVREGYMVLASSATNGNDDSKKPSIKGHPVQLNLNSLCDELERRMTEWGCDYIYAEYQTKYVERFFEKRFGDKFIHTNRIRIDLKELDYDEYVLASHEKLKHLSIVENNIEYLESIFLLSKCTSIFSSKSSGTIVALLWNNDEYENYEIVDSGVY